MLGADTVFGVKVSTLAMFSNKVCLLSESYSVSARTTNISSPFTFGALRKISVFTELTVKIDKTSILEYCAKNCV